MSNAVVAVPIADEGGIRSKPPITPDRIDSTDRLPSYPQQQNASPQMNSASQFSDVQTSDWAFQALQSLRESYGCISGYSDGTFRGNRTLSRYEFATGLNACLNRVNELIAAGTSNLLRPEDVATLKRLQEEFTVELTTLRGRIDNLEAHAATLEAQQFSTTAKLNGELIVDLAGFNGNTNPNLSNRQTNTNVILADRLRINFDTSFSGKDRLRVRLTGYNVPNLTTVTGTNMARLNAESNGGNAVSLGYLSYRTPVGKNLNIIVEPAGGSLDDYADVLSPYFYLAVSGSISRFSSRNPLYRHGGGSGAAIIYNPSKSVEIDTAYLVNGSSNPAVGVTTGPFSALGQITWRPGHAALAFTYVHTYSSSAVNNLSTGTGSFNAENPFPTSNSVTGDALGGELTYQIIPKFGISGWINFTNAKATDLTRKPQANIFSYGVNFGFPDLGGKGNLLGLAIGQPPKVTRNDLGRNFRDRDTSLLFEGFYRIQLNDKFSLSPGVYVITNPNHDVNNNTVFVGTLRTGINF